MAILAQNLRSKTVQKTDSSNIINLPKRAGRSWEDSAGKDVKLMTWKIPSKISREFAWNKNSAECVVSRIGMGGSWSAIWLGFMGCLGRKCQEATPFRFGGVCFWRCRCSIFYFPCCFFQAARTQSYS